ncbi:META domain-containing protein [Leptolyngbya sp. 15MV]|nr:META domain-containing protein [Leptolyngbya sp. 15MV]
MRLAAIALAVLLTACAAEPPRATPAAAQAPTSLAGTNWELVELRSSDDAIGVVRVQDPTRYTLAFDTEGNAFLRLDCNRGRGRVTITPERADMGRLQFGPVAATRALCPPGSLGPRLEREIGAVRLYVMQPDGRLRLELFADGGQQIWQRAP